jgi:hypothetical protein
MKQVADEYAIRLNRWFGQYQGADFESSQAEASLLLCAHRRASALVGLHDVDGYSLAQIAGAVGLSRARVCQLIARGRRGPAVPSKVFCVNCGGALPGGCRCDGDDGDDGDELGETR